MTMRPHLAAIPGSSWQVWRWALLRSAGFPVDGLDDLSAPDLAAVADAYLAGQATEEDYDLAFDQAGAALAKAVYDVAGQPRFRSAVTWQNPGVVRAADSVLRDGPDAVRNERRRRREEIIAKYWQRYCGKNDSAGFFGPMCWVRLEPDAPAVTGGPGAGLIRAQFVHFEWWALAALADTLAADPIVRPWLPLALPPHVDVVGRTLRQPGAPGVALSAAEAALLARADGRRPAFEVAAELLAEPGLGFHAANDVYALADRLEQRTIVRRGLDLPFNLDAESVLRSYLKGIGDEAVRARALEPLRRLGEHRDAIAAADDPERLAAAMAALDEEFSTLTGHDARRRGGQTYAGRTLAYVDAVRDLDLTFGQAVLDRLAPLTPLLDSARWLTAELAQAYGQILDELYADLVAERGSGVVPFDELWFLAQGALFGAVRPSDTVLAEYLRRWRAALGLDFVAPGTRRLDIDLAELTERVGQLFPAERPGWAGARFHSPDLHISAPDVASIQAGRFSLVLGELHIGLAALDTHFFKLGHPAPQELVDAMAADISAPRLRPALSDEWARNSARNADWLLGSGDATVGFAAASGVDRDRLIPVTAFVVEPGGRDAPVGSPASRPVVRSADGRRWPLIEAFAELIGIHAVDTWKLAGDDGHTPRVTVEDMVLLREAWRTTVGETGLADATGERNRMLAVRRWRRSLDLPERIFVRMATEIKPCYVDLSSPVYTRVLCGLVRGAREKAGPGIEMVVTEMLPLASDAWVTDAQDRRYSSELRLQLLDPVPAYAVEPERAMKPSTPGEPDVS
jgi:hypothetical protein